MILVDNLVVEGGRFKKDSLSDNIYEAKVRVSLAPDFRDVFSVQYLPDEKGLVLYTSITPKVFSFNEKTSPEDTYDFEEVLELKRHIGCEESTIKKLIDTIFDLAYEAV